VLEIDDERAKAGSGKHLRDRRVRRLHECAEQRAPARQGPSKALLRRPSRQGAPPAPPPRCG
jgi:hypothetical protein